MPALTYAGSNSATTSGAASLAVGAPAGLSVRTLLLATLAIGTPYPPSLPTVTPPAGWTALTPYAWHQGSYNGGAFSQVFWRWWNLGDSTSYTWNVSASRPLALVVVGYVNAHNSYPIAAYSRAVYGGSSRHTHTTPTVAAPVAGCRVMSVFNARTAGMTWIGPEDDIECADVRGGSSTPAAVLAVYDGAAAVGSNTRSAYASIATYTATFWIVAVQPSASLNLTGSITPSGTLRRVPQKRLGGTITASGALDVRRVVLRFFTGTITAVGTLRRGPYPKRFTASITPVGTLRRGFTKRFTASITPSATLRRSVVRRFGGSITPVGTAYIQFVGRVFGRPGLVAMIYRKAGDVRVRIRRG